MAVLRMAAPAKLGLPRSRGQAGKGARRFGSRSGGARQARRTLALVLLATCAAASAAGGLRALAGLEDARRLVQHTGEVIGQANGLLTALVLDALPRRAPARPIERRGAALVRGDGGRT